MGGHFCQNTWGMLRGLQGMNNLNLIENRNYEFPLVFSKQMMKVSQVDMFYGE